jgi:Fe-Mn family superoxide dismutase
MNHTYEAKKFNIGELSGISSKQLEIHIKLYEGYVKFTNHLREVLADLRKDSEKNAYALGEVLRRFGFEFNGMRMHEYYFEQFEKGATPTDSNSKMAVALVEKYGSWDEFINHFKSVGLTRGIGWTILYFDPVGNTPHTVWVNEHELGQLTGLPVILAMDMWEHAYMVDYLPAEKKNYIDAFFNNLNWKTSETRFNEATS